MIDHNIIFRGGVPTPLDPLADREREARIAEAEQSTQRRRTLGELLPLAMQGDQTAMAGIARADPSTFMSLQTHQRQRANDQREVLGRLATAVRQRPLAERQAYIQQLMPQLRQAGVPDADIMNFDPSDQNLDALIALGGDRTRQDNGPNIQREVDYYRSIGRPDLAQQILERHAAGPPVVVDNGDGTRTIYPPAAIYGGGSVPPPQSAPPPQSGQPVRVNTPEEARRLPPGTTFQTPDGRTFRVPAAQGGAGPSGPRNFR